jgi:hypothetical protein
LKHEVARFPERQERGLPDTPATIWTNLYLFFA